MERETLNSLVAGPEEWSRYREESGQSRWDLSAAQLSDLDLRGRDFSNCDLDGATLDHANLAGSDFAAVTIRHASFAGAICDRTTWHDSVVEECVFDRASMTDVSLQGSFVGCRFANSRWSRTRIERTTIDDCDLKGARLIDTSLVDVSVRRGSWGIDAKGLQWRGGRLDEVSFDRAQLTSSAFRGVEFQELSLDGTTIGSTHFIECECMGPMSGLPRFEHCRFSRCLLDRVGLAGSGILGSVFDDVSVSHCEWPPQSGRITPLGAYIPAEELLRSPVQDVRGLAPVFRRQIADAQYLTERKATVAGHDALWFRVWGATTGYGQSFGRLIAALSGVLFALTCVVVGYLVLHAGWPATWCLLSEVTVGVLSASVNVGGAEIPGHSHALVAGIGYVANLVGLLALGLLAGLVANRIGRLSF